MSKTTKVIAALGVVAGLGVAALPAFTYAAQVSGNADVIVEVGDAIAMSIVGNQDGVQDSGYNNVKIKSAEINNIAGVDVTSYVTTGAATSGSKVSMLPNSVINGGFGAADAQGFKSTINVYTNANAYNLTINDADSTLALVNQSDSSATIPAGTESEGSFSLVAGTPAWGYKVDAATESADGYKAITASPVEIKYAANDATQTVVNYGVATSSTQKTGIYKDTIVYTATTNTTAPTAEPGNGN